MKKIISILLATVLLSGSITPVLAADTSKAPDYSITSEFNYDITETAVASVSEELRTFNNTRNEKNITVNLFENSQNKTDSASRNDTNNKLYDALGSITIAGGNYEYTASGSVLTKMLSNNNTGLIGNLTGTTNRGEHINLTIHSIPAENKSFVFVSVGYLTTDSVPEIYIYGESFEELGELTSEYMSQQEGVYTLEDDEKYVPETINSTAMTRAAADYNTQFRAMVIGGARTPGGEDVQLAALTFYAPLRMETNKVYKAGVKLNGHAGNAAYYFRANIIPGVLSAWNSSGMVEIKAANNYMELSALDPEDESWNITLNVPGLEKISSIFAWFPVSFNIGINTIKTTRTKNEGSSYYNQARWNHNYSRDMSWEDGDPVTTQNGYSGQVSLTYLYNRTYDYTTSLTANSTINYQFRSQFGVETYTGGVTVYANGGVASVVIDATN